MLTIDPWKTKNSGQLTACDRTVRNFLSLPSITEGDIMQGCQCVSEAFSAIGPIRAQREQGERVFVREGGQLYLAYVGLKDNEARDRIGDCLKGLALDRDFWSAEVYTSMDGPSKPLPSYRANARSMMPVTPAKGPPHFQIGAINGLESMRLYQIEDSHGGVPESISGTLVLECRYQVGKLRTYDEKEGRMTSSPLYFWYRADPPRLRDALQATSAASKLRLIGAALDFCPAKNPVR